MSRWQRAKGRRGELEVAARLNDLLIGADASLIYGQEEIGGRRGDVASTLGNFEVKRRATFPDWLEIADGVRGVYCRRDRGEWYVVIRASDFEALLCGLDRMREINEPPRSRHGAGEMAGAEAEG